MQLVEYNDLNSHAEYLKIIGLLERKSEYIEYVLVDEDDTRLVDKFSDYVISLRQKNEWWGTKSAQKAKVYKIKASKELFQYLRKFDTFCKFTTTISGDIAKITNFGINDIAFFDNHELPLLFTTTHEGYVSIRDDLL